MWLKKKYTVGGRSKRVGKASGAATSSDNQKKHNRKPWAKVQSSVALRKVA